MTLLFIQTTGDNRCFFNHT